MKKLDDKMLTKGRGEEEEEKYDDGIDAITCDCCDQTTTTSSTPQSVTETEEQVNDDFEQGHDHHHEDNKYKKKFDNPKLLIIIGLALTIPIVLLEINHHNIIIDYVTLALATPVQFILGKPFYIRFYRAVVMEKSICIHN